MKSVFLVIALACPLQAELLATFHTTQGNVVVALQYDTAPQAVANCITLAQGTRKWVNPLTGAVTNAPYYNGIKIHRTSNNSSFKFAHGGSPKGDGSDGPGYTFKDEFNPSRTHVPYVLSMANAGPNTNGSQFFFTGSLSQPTFNNVHTIFGIVTDPSSRAVVDAMITAGNNGTTIIGVTFARTDAAAIAFDEHAQNLPVVTCPAGNLSVSRSVAATWHLSQAMNTGTIFRAFRSTTLTSASWSELGAARQHVGLDDPALASSVLDNAAAPQAFYNLSESRHPGAVAPSTLANRTVLIELSGGLLYYENDATGNGGMATYVPSVGTPFDFPFNTYNFTSNAHDIVFIAENIGITPAAILIKIGCDSATNIQIDGRHTTTAYNTYFGTWDPFASGLAAISR